MWRVTFIESRLQKCEKVDDAYNTGIFGADPGTDYTDHQWDVGVYPDDAGRCWMKQKNFLIGIFLFGFCCMMSGCTFPNQVIESVHTGSNLNAGISFDIKNGMSKVMIENLQRIFLFLKANAVLLAVILEASGILLLLIFKKSKHMIRTAVFICMLSGPILIFVLFYSIAFTLNYLYTQGVIT